MGQVPMTWWHLLHLIRFEEKQGNQRSTREMFARPLTFASDAEGRRERNRENSPLRLAPVKSITDTLCMFSKSGSCFAHSPVQCRASAVEQNPKPIWQLLVVQGGLRKSTSWL